MKSFRKNGKEKPIIIGDNIKRKRHGFFRFLKNFKFPDLSDNPKVQFMNEIFTAVPRTVGLHPGLYN